MLLVACYPLVVFLGLRAFSLQQIALVLLAIFVVRLSLSAYETKQSQSNSNQQDKDVVRISQQLGMVGGLCIVGWVLLADDEFVLKLYPALINLLMFCAFAWTLVNPPPAIERIARRFEPNLSETGIHHTRQFTLIWCVFFVANGAIAFYTAAFASLDVWTIYNGLVSYLLIATMFAIEFVIRLFRKRRAGE